MPAHKIILTVLKGMMLAAAFVVLWLVLRGVGLRNVFEAMRSVDRTSLAASAALFFAVFWCWTLRWQQIMKPQSRPNLLALFPIFMAGVFGNLVSPGARVGSEPIRAYYMSKVFGGDKAGHFGTALADKFTYTVVFVAFLLVSVVFIIIYVPVALASKVVMGGAVVLVVAAVISGFLLREHIGARVGLLARLMPGFYNSWLMRGLRRRFPTYQHFEDYAIRKLGSIWEPIASAAGSPRVIARVSVLAALSWLIWCTANYVLFRALGADISFVGVFIIATLSTTVGDVSVSPGGAGFTEAVMIGLCAAFGLDSRTAAAVTLISRGIFYFYGFVLGGSCIVALSLIYGRRPARQ